MVTKIKAAANTVHLYLLIIHISSMNDAVIIAINGQKTHIRDIFAGTKQPKIEKRIAPYIRKKAFFGREPAERLNCLRGINPARNFKRDSLYSQRRPRKKMMKKHRYVPENSLSVNEEKPKKPKNLSR